MKAVGTSALKRRRASGVFAWLAAIYAASFCLPSPLYAQTTQSVWELTPYRICVLVAAAPKPEITPRLVERVRAVIAERADTAVGGCWDLRVEAAPAALQPAMLASLGKLPFEQLPQELLDGDDDKAILAAIDYRNGSFLVEARDVDLRCRLHAPPVRRAARSRATLGDDAFRAVAAAFAPLAQIEKVEDKQATLRLRAAALPVIDPSLTAAQPGDMFRGVIRFNDRDGKLRKLMPLDWTFLGVEQVSGPELTCTLYSGLRSPLSGRRRGRIEQLALLTRPPGGTTRLQLTARPTPDDADSGRPLAGYAIYAHPAGSPTTELLGRTDGFGELPIPATNSPVRILLVKHGGEPLARLPIMPGLEPLVQVIIADDDQRLAAEGMVTGLQENFVELVANRAVLMSRIRARIREGKLDEAKLLMEELRKLGRQDDLSLMIDLRKRTAASPDARMQRKIDRLFEDTREIVNHFLNQSEINRLESELAAALRGEPLPPDEKVESGG
jgi:hypothetical protein